MVWKFGDIEFQPKTSPSDISIDRGVNLSEQERLLGAPTLQDVGGVLTRIEMNIRLHVSAGGDVRERLNAFIFAMNSKEPKPFINGAGFSEGDFVVTNLRSTYEKTDDLGRLLWVELSVSLKEYVEAEIEDREVMAARKAAVATISANPITTVPTVKYQTSKALVMRDITTGVSSAGAAAAAGKTAMSVPDVIKKEANIAKNALVTARDSLTKARQGVEQIQGEIANAVALKNSLTSTLNTVEQMYAEIETGDPSASLLGGFGQMLETGIDGILTQSAQLSTLIALRK